MATDIVLSTLNSKYIHSAFGLRYIYANLQELRDCSRIVEFTIKESPLRILEELLAYNPRIVGFGVYIWNVERTLEVIQALKRVRPDVVVVIGGPEVSYEIEEQAICRVADYVVTGEADDSFRELCRRLLLGEAPQDALIRGVSPRLEALRLPYEEYVDEDIRNRVLYVEASRGCPFTCEFCLSSLDQAVRRFPLEALFDALDRLIERGAERFKFVDRTFNLSAETSRGILEFFLERYRPGMFFHFEMVPDRLPEPIRESLRGFPPGALQLEVGLQTLNDRVSALISRRQNLDKVAANFEFLRRETGVYIHADLIVGLPGETIASFADGFDRLFSMGPQEIQVGILKRLRGTPIVRHDREYEMVYHPAAPYEILQTRDVTFEEMARMRRFAKYWDLVVNSGRFPRLSEYIWRGESSVFWSFDRLSAWLFGKLGRMNSIGLDALAKRLFEYLTDVRGLPHVDIASALWRDLRDGGFGRPPSYLRNVLGSASDLDGAAPSLARPSGGLPDRQARRLNANEDFSPVKESH